MGVRRGRAYDAIVSEHREPCGARPDPLRSKLASLEAELLQCRKRVDLFERVLLKIGRFLSDRSSAIDYETLILHQFHHTITQEHSDLRRETADIRSRIEGLKVHLRQPLK